MKKLTALALSATLLLSIHAAQARSAAQVQQQIDSATAETLSVYERSGMAGLQENTQRCYRSTAVPAFRCVYLDMTARLLDEGIAKTRGYSTYDFFTNDTLFDARVAPTFESLNLRDDEVGQYVQSLGQAIESSLYQQMQKRLSR